MHFPPALFSESAELFLLKHARKIQPDANAQHGKFQPELLKFRKIIFFKMDNP